MRFFGRLWSVFDEERLTLPVENIDLTVFLIDERFIREVVGALRHLDILQPMQFLIFEVVEEVVVAHLFVMKEGHEQSLLVNERAHYVGIAEAVNGRRVVIQTQLLIETEVLFQCLLNRARFLAEYTHVEITVIKVGDCKLGARWVLLDIFHLNII